MCRISSCAESDIEWECVQCVEKSPEQTRVSNSAKAVEIVEDANVVRGGSIE
jgi:hypothetical protein